MKLKYLSCLVLASVAFHAPYASAENKGALYFNTTSPENDLQGSLSARVYFAQSQVLPAHVKDGDRQPHLTSLRKSLLLLQPLNIDDTPIKVEARDKDGKTLGVLTLSPPSALPDTVYHLDGVPDQGIEFIPLNGTTKVVNNVTEVNKLSDSSGVSIKTYLADNSLVDIHTADGRWVRNIYLPQSPELEGKMVR